MMVHGGIPLGDAWAYLRDHAQGTTPYAQSQIDACRTYTEPSKAHKRRLLKVRTEISKVRISKPKPADSVRSRAIEAMNYGREIQRMIQPNKMAPARPAPRVFREQAVGPNVPLCETMLAKRREQKIEEARRIASYGINEVTRAWRVYQERDLNV